MQAALSAKDLLFTLVLKVGFSASLAALLVRFARFRRVLFTEERNSDEKLQLLLFLTPPIAIAVVLRLVGYQFFDISLAGAFLMGLIGGRMVGLLGGSMLSLPAFGHHEWLVTPMAALVGLLAGVIRQGLPNKEDIWHFGPFLFLNIPQSLWKLVRRGQMNWAMVPLGACIAVELGWDALAQVTPEKWLYRLSFPSWPWLLLIVLSTVMSVAVPVKIWNNTRIEMNLEQNRQLLLKARMDALSRQINPHFLFNTLNTVSSLVRYDPDMARVVVLKLSNIMRKLLRTHETFVPLRDELDFIDDYLDIEVARFGRDKLQFFKEADAASLDAFVPSMLLQPIIENAIRHGLAPKLEGGEIRLSTKMAESRLTIEIYDNGMGISPERLTEIYHEGIGISNVRERLRLLYGDQFRMEIKSQEGLGTQIRIEIPELIESPVNAALA
ncbi:MAG TPA: histidine kinase [Verrucomicrobiae bacterium]|nr:histidine kinase [Verrucomicrobiae bacterium]